MKIVKRGLLVAATAMPMLAGVTGVVGTGVASAAAQAAMPGHLTVPAPSFARGGVPASGRAAKPGAMPRVLKPRKAGAAHARPHTVNLRQLMKRVKSQPAPRTGKKFAPRADVSTPNGADITSQFDGTSEISSGQSGGLPGIPDPESATNGSQIVEVVFGSRPKPALSAFIQVTDNNGISQCLNGSGLPISTFLQTTEPLGDPRVQYDNAAGHFIMSIPVESFTGSDVPALYVAISNTSDPCGNWHWYRMTFSGGPYAPGNRLDRVMLGQDRNAVLFQTNIFSSSQVFQGFSIFAISKADLYANNGVSFPAFTVGSQAAPAINAGEPMISSSSAWFVGADPNVGYQLYRMNGTGTSSPTVTLQTTISAPYNQPSTAAEPGGGINFLDGFIDSAAVFDGTRIWFTHGISRPPNDPTTLLYGYIDVTANQATRALMFVDPPNSFEFNGSVGIGLNANGTESVFLNWAYTDPSKNLTVSDAVDSFVFNGSLPSVIGGMQTLLTGTAGDNSLFSNNSSVAVENRQIGNTTCAITTQQYFNGSWDTRLARICSPNQINVPFEAGLTPAQASASLAGFGLTLGSQSTTTNCDGIIPGEVVSTTPAFNTPVPFGTAINVLVCTSPTTRVPNVTGDTVGDAVSAIQGAGLVAGSVSSKTSCDVPKGTIISTSPKAGSVVSFGTTVNMTQSSGLPKNPCP